MNIDERSELELIFQRETNEQSREEVDMYGGGSTVIYADEYVEWLEARIEAISSGSPSH